MKRSQLIPIVLLALSLLLAAATAAFANGDDTAIPDDCPVGQYLCLTPGTGGYVMCDGGILDVQPDPNNSELSIVFCEHASYSPVLIVPAAREAEGP